MSVFKYLAIASMDRFHSPPSPKYRLPDSWVTPPDPKEKSVKYELPKKSKKHNKHQRKYSKFL